MSAVRRTITHDGLSLTAQEWADRLGIHSSTLYQRIKSWGVERALTEGKQTLPQLTTQSGVTGTVYDWAEILGIHPQTLRHRVRTLGVEKALTLEKDYREVRRYEHDGISFTAQEWADRLGIHVGTLYARIHRLGVERALSKPKRIPIDLTGRQFGSLTVKGKSEYRSDKDLHVFWECECVCTRLSKAPTNKLLDGSTKSCGCKSRWHKNYIPPLKEK